MRNHTDFIISPITDILKDVVSASAGIGSGIETSPLCDYVMQSVFLKMTGFQEQKMKCVTWELATVDYEYRRTLLANDDRLGECSSYDDKNKIYKRLTAQIQKYNPKFDIDIDTKKILNDTILYVKNVFEKSNLSIWAQNSFIWFVDNKSIFKPEHFAYKNDKGKTNLFENVLQDKYEVLYNHRNRIAHNTHSYQQNLPTLKTLMSDEYKYENYFVYFSILVLIDKVFIELYKKYLAALEDSTS
ncbi:MAG: hypothetical protein KIT62_11605 [Cyclobacteriaceae bacterium]|nr:hypothetical protein [Cyclobacteriaceae bacterium]